MSSFSSGHVAEQKAAEYLTGLGYKIVDKNWRTRYCEIDIIAKKDNCVYFVEVKYRAHDDQGTGLDYITPKKLKQMAFAAEMWIQNKAWDGDFQLAVVSVDGDDILFLDEVY